MVVDDHEPAVGREVNIAFDQVTPDRDGRAKGPHGVLGVLGRVASMAAHEWPAIVVGRLISIADGMNQAPVSLTVN
jgi:hypothetical protein